MRYRALIVTLLAVCLSVLTACGGAPTTSSDLLTYDQIRGTGLANNCPQLGDITRGSIPIESGKSYKLTSLCLQPQSFYVKEEGTKRQQAAFVPGKLMTRLTSSLDAIQGTLTQNSDGSLTFTEEDGIDFQAITVQLPGGERVPFLFTIKSLVATTDPGQTTINASTDFVGEFRVPSYRTSNFLDPKGRGLTAGYDNAVALPSRADDEELLRENLKQFQLDSGKIFLQVSKVDGSTGELVGSFESIQPSETDMGSREPSEVKIRGTFYGRVEAEAA
jgi:photosystem II oxygen-evolving enhancer protein 1